MIKIPVKDPRTASTVANYVDVILDFTDFNPPYWLRSDKDTGEGHWWYYQTQTNTVHVLIAEDVRKEFVSLMTQKNNDEKLTCEKIKTLEAICRFIKCNPAYGGTAGN